MAGFRRWWRVTLTWQSGAYSPTGHPEQVIDVDSVARLRTVVLGARADPRVEAYGYRLVRHWVDDRVDDGHAPRCARGHELPPVRYEVEDCTCGDGHLRTACTCGDIRYVPERGPGCGPVPYDPEAGRHCW